MTRPNPNRKETTPLTTFYSVDDAWLNPNVSRQVRRHAERRIDKMPVYVSAKKGVLGKVNRVRVL